MSPEPELVERVAYAMRVAFEAPIREAGEWRPIARYALELAERAAREAVAWAPIDMQGDIERAVERAVEGA